MTRCSAGNKLTAASSHQDKGPGDSTLGKMMEKAGAVLGKDELVEKGREKREAAAAVAAGGGDSTGRG